MVLINGGFYMLRSNIQLWPVSLLGVQNQLLNNNLDNTANMKLSVHTAVREPIEEYQCISIMINLLLYKW